MAAAGATACLSPISWSTFALPFALPFALAAAGAEGSLSLTNSSFSVGDRLESSGDGVVLLHGRGGGNGPGNSIAFGAVFAFAFDLPFALASTAGSASRSSLSAAGGGGGGASHEPCTAFIYTGGQHHTPTPPGGLHEQMVRTRWGVKIPTPTGPDLRYPPPSGTLFAVCTLSGVRGRPRKSYGGDSGCHVVHVHHTMVKPCTLRAFAFLAAAFAFDLTGSSASAPSESGH